MRFPLPLTAKIAAYVIGHKLRGTKKFATVLQLEPLHTCNLTCTGCGRIREYSTSLKDVMSLEDCLAAAQECNAPMISICGGEPLVYPHIEALVDGVLAQGRIVYICTNAVFMRKKMREWLAKELSNAQNGSGKKMEEKVDLLLKRGLISEKDAAEILAKKRREIEGNHTDYHEDADDGPDNAHDAVPVVCCLLKERTASAKVAADSFPSSAFSSYRLT